MKRMRQKFDASFLFKGSFICFFIYFCTAKETQHSVMKSTQLHNAKSLRFRRWSRVGYAVFCSLACSVSIGFLSVSVSGSFIKKTAGCGVSVPLLTLLDAESPSSVMELEKSEMAQQQLAQIIISEKVFDSAAAGCQPNYYTINLKG